MGFIAWLKHEGLELKALFGSHEAALSTLTTDLQQGATAAAAIATAAGETKAVPILTDIADGAGKINIAIQAGATANDLADGVKAVTGLATGLVNSGDIGVKDAGTKAAIGGVVAKVSNVAEVAQAAIENAAPAAQAAS